MGQIKLTKIGEFEIQPETQLLTTGELYTPEPYKINVNAYNLFTPKKDYIIYSHYEYSNSKKKYILWSRDRININTAYELYKQDIKNGYKRVLL